MPRILIGECKQEVSSFNPVPSSYADFDLSFGDAVLDFHRGLKSEIGGALDVFATRPDLELVPTYSARAITSGGTLTAASFARIGEAFLAAVRAAPPVDGIYLSLHGAMSVAGEDDPEGWLLAGCGKLSGNGCRLWSRSICMGYSPTACCSTAMRLSPITPIPMSIFTRRGYVPHTCS
ncbi:MAG: M81 family metallopeptidase [Caldilineaceae bacterium]